MNILYISSKKRWGGVVSWMQKTAIGLENKGHKVWIVTHPDSRFTKSASKKLRLIKKKLGMNYNPIIILFFIYFIKKNKIDLILTNIRKELIAGGIAAKFCGIPNVRRIGTSFDINNKHKLLHTTLTDHSIIPCNRILTDAKITSPWLKPETFTTIYNGRNITHFTQKEIIAQRKIWGLTENDFIIGCTCQLIKVKRVDILIQIFKRVLNKFSDCYLVITGEGRERRFLEQEVKRLSIEDKVVFAGYSSNPMLTAAAYNIGVLISSFEGFPNSVVEYFAAGTPVVVTNVGGVAEMIKDEFNGSLVDAGNDDQFYTKLIALIEDSDMRVRFSKNAQQTISQNFSETMMIDHLEQLFLNIVKKK